MGSNQLIRLPRELVIEIHLIASLKQGGRPSALPEVCHSLEWLKGCGRSQVLNLSNSSCGLSARLESVLESELASGGLDDLRYARIIVDARRLYRSGWEWRARWAAGDEIVVRGHDKILKGQLRHQQQLRKLLTSLSNVRHLHIDMGILGLGLGSPMASDMIWASWSSWNPKFLAHLDVAADDETTAYLIARCQPGVLKALHICHGVESKSFEAARHDFGPTLEKFGLSLHSTLRSTYAAGGRAQLGLGRNSPTPGRCTISAVSMSFSSLKWLAIGDTPGSSRRAARRDYLHRDIVPSPGDSALVAKALQSLPKLKKLALPSDYDIMPGNNREEAAPRWAKRLFDDNPNIRTLWLLDTSLRYWMIENLAMTGQRPGLPLIHSTDNYDHFGDTKGFRGFPMTLTEEPWEHTYRKDCNGQITGFSK